jgi:hypothetical protein
MVLNHPESLHEIWHHDKWTYFLLRPWVSLPVSLVMVVSCLLYSQSREPARAWEDRDVSWRSRIAKPHSIIGTLWFTLELILSSVAATVMFGELVRLSAGTYAPVGWIKPDGIGTYMWLARMNVFVAMAGSVQDFYRRAHVHPAEIAYLIGHVWLTGTWLSSPYTQSTASVMIPWGFVVDRAMVSSFRIQIERCREFPIDLLRGPLLASRAAQTLFSSRRTVRLCVVLGNVSLFFLHATQHRKHKETAVHILSVVLHVCLVVWFEWVRSHRLRSSVVRFDTSKSQYMDKQGNVTLGHRQRLRALSRNRT